MRAPLAIGIGCRRDCPVDSIVALVGAARDRVGRDRPARLFTLLDKVGEPGLCAAAARLGLDLVGLPRDALAAAMPGVVTRSAAATAAVGLASVSEAAALAGAGHRAVLILARIAAGGATCAVAASAESLP